MAIPIGTTSRQLESLARWALAAVLAAGPLMWGRPGFGNWGSMIACLMGLWAIWMLWRTSTAQRWVPGNLAHWTLAALAGIVLYQIGEMQWRYGHGTVGGSMLVSLLCHLALLSMAIMLVESLLGRATKLAIVLPVGLAMMAGAIFNLMVGEEPVRVTPALMGFSGAMVWLSSLACGVRSPALPAVVRALLTGAIGAVALAAVAMLTWFSPQAAAISLFAAAAAAMLAVTLYGSGTARTVGAIALAAALLGAAALGYKSLAGLYSCGPMGRGQWSMAYLETRSSGWTELGSACGWVGAGLLLAGFSAGVVAAMWRGRSQKQLRMRSALWCAAAGISMAAMLAPGGLYVPTILLGVALTWGLLHEMTGSPPTQRSGLWVAMAFFGLMIVLGLTTQNHVIFWSTKSFGGDDKFLHMSTGMLLTLLLVWLLGSRKLWKGLAMVAFSIVIACLAELMQKKFSLRNAEWEDVLAHTVGAAAAATAYVLCMLSRWCESPDARTKEWLEQRLGR